MNIEHSTTTITLTLNKRQFLIGLTLTISSILLIMSVLAVPLITAISGPSINSGGLLYTGQSFYNEEKLQTAECQTQFTQITQILTVVARSSVIAFLNAMTHPSDAQIFSDITADFSSTYVVRNVVTASSVNSDGCGQDLTQSFNPDDRVYIVMENSDFASGTVLFARLYFNGEVVSDTDEIVADQDYFNMCANLWFEDISGFEPGAYTIELIVNGNQTTEVTFDVQ